MLLLSTIRIFNSLFLFLVQSGVLIEIQKRQTLMKSGYYYDKIGIIVLASAEYIDGSWGIYSMGFLGQAILSTRVPREGC